MIDTTLESAKPRCAVFGQCGGCQYQHLSYPAQLSLKEGVVRTLFESAFNLPPDVFEPILPSPESYGYRNRLDLKLKNTRTQGVFIGFSPAVRGGVIPVDHCPIAMSAISDAIPRIKEEAISIVTAKYRQASLVVRAGDDGRVFWGGIGRRSNKQLPQDYLWTEIYNRRIYYSLDTFFQANLSILPSVMDAIRALPIWEHEADFFDLYGGVGLFGICLADLVNHVHLIEENVHAVRLARHNLEHLKLNNMTLHQGSVEDQLPPLLAASGTHRKIVMVDPPRAGLSDAAIGFINQIEPVDHLLYVSCHPETLVENLKVMTQTRWRIRQVRPMDFFPQTRHIETLVWLQRINGT